MTKQTIISTLLFLSLINPLYCLEINQYLNAFSPKSQNDSRSLKTSGINSMQNSSLSITNIQSSIFGDAVFTPLASNRLSMEAAGTEETISNIRPAMIGSPLNYPNPFRMSEGTNIGYMLNSNMDVEIRIYSMSGYLITQKMLTAGADEGAKAGYNRIPIDFLLEGTRLPAGIYFYLILYKGDVIGKEKLAVWP